MDERDGETEVMIDFNTKPSEVRRDGGESGRPRVALSCVGQLFFLRQFSKCASSSVCRLSYSSRIPRSRVRHLCIVLNPPNMVQKVYVTYNEVEKPPALTFAGSETRVNHLLIQCRNTQIHRLCQQAAPKILDEFKPNLMIAIGGGGYVPARILVCRHPLNPQQSHTT